MKPTTRISPPGTNRTFYPGVQFAPSQHDYSGGFKGNQTNVSTPHPTFQSPGRMLNFRGSSPMETAKASTPCPVFQSPVRDLNLKYNDNFETNGGKKINKKMQAAPSYGVGYGRNLSSPKSPVSNLFERMYQSSLSGSSSELSSHSGGSGWNSRTDDHRSNSRSTGDQVIAQLRSCSSQNDLFGEFKETRRADRAWKASEAPKSLNLDKSSSIRPFYTSDSIPVNSRDLGSYSNRPSLDHEHANSILQDPFRSYTHKSEKIVFQSSQLSPAPDRIASKEHLHDSHRVEQHPESEEPLPCDPHPGHLERMHSGYREVPSLPDLQLTVFLRDAPANKSFDIGASKYINKPYQRLPSEPQTGSMPYRVKRSTPLTISSTSGELERVVVPESGLGSPPLITPDSGDISSVFTPNQPTARSGDLSGPPAYTGPRLIPLERSRESTGSESHTPMSSESHDLATAERLAKRLFDLDGFRKCDVVKHLGKRTEFSCLVRESYLRNFDFSSMTLDIALRHFLSHLVLSGETQERERVLAQFSHRFFECNPHSFSSQDSCHMLVCGIMILNTDLHGKNGRKRMTVNEFIENLSGQNGGADFPKDLLKNVYQSIKNDPIEFQANDDEVNPDSSKDEQSIQLQSNPFLDIPDPSKAREFKTDYLMRKCCLESDGRRTPMGKRGWKKFRTSLRELILYLHKDEHGFDCGTTFDDTSNAVRIHHSLAFAASDYAKRHNVFRLRTADWAEYLFQASTTQECQSWIDTINGVAAAFSSPPLPGAVGSQVKFQRPLMPSSSTKLSLRDQLAQHEQMLAQVEKDLAEHREFVPEKGSRPRVIQDYLEKENYLEFEQRRFRTYCSAVQSMLRNNIDLTKAPIAEGYFEKTKPAQGSGRFPQKAFAKDGNIDSTTVSHLDYAEGEKRNRLQGGNASPYHGLHPAKSVPVLLYESRV